MLWELNSFFKDLKHVRRLGFGYLARHPKAWLGRETAAASVRGVGPIHMRYRGSDAGVVRQVFSRREYDLSKYPQKTRVFAAYEAALAAGKTPLIIDAGANIGAASIWYAQRFPKALVLAIEPDADNVALCERNVARFANIKVVAGAIGARAGKVDLVNPNGQAYAIRTERAETGAVPMYSVADLKALAGPNAQILLVKVDIEGFESDLFSENLDWLDETSAVIVEPHDWMLPGQYASRPLQKAMFSREFELLVRHESLIFIR